MTLETPTGDEPRAMVKQAMVLKLYPNAQQAAEMRRWIGTTRALWNHLLDLQKRTLDETGKLLNGKALEQARQAWEKEPGCNWRMAAQSQTRQRIVKELDRAWRDFFKSRKGERAGDRLGVPKFKAKRPGGTLYLANTRFSIDVERRSLSLHKLGDIKFRGGRDVTGRVLGARIRYTAGLWYIAIQVEAPPPRVYGKPSAEVIGVDVGLKAAVARSDGVITTAPKFYRKAEKRLARLQRRVSASKRGSRRCRRKAACVARLQHRIANQRRDFLHVRSARVVGKAAVVAIETLNIKGMARSRLAKSIHDAGMGELHRQIEYKAAWSGRKVGRVPRFEATTKPCSVCGAIHEMKLHHRVMRCECGNEMDRDLNAAINIARIGLAQVAVVDGKPAPKGPTRGEIGCQARTAGPSLPVPVVEPRSHKRATVRGPRGRAPDILVHTGKLKKLGISSPSLGPLFEWNQ